MPAMPHTMGRVMLKQTSGGSFQGILTRIVGNTLSRCFFFVFGPPD